MDLFSLSSYDYRLPKELIAKYPTKTRDESRLMLIDRQSGSISESSFRDILHLLKANDQLIFNDTRVLPARLIGYRPTGGKAEILLVRHESEHTWKVLAKPAKKLKVGAEVIFSSSFKGRVLDDLDQGLKLMKFQGECDFQTELTRHGKIPLPPYLGREAEEIDQTRYQTVYAKHSGAVAAPTAGLHFSEKLLQKAKEKEVQLLSLTLHVGLGTFKAVEVSDIRQHQMHSESFQIDPTIANWLNRNGDSQQICIGTTTLRALESASDEMGVVQAGEHDTDIFIYPGYSFRKAQALLTNFHLPQSTLLMLVSAFAGYELTMEAYAKAVEKKFRFFSYGDAMLIQ